MSGEWGLSEWGLGEWGGVELAVGPAMTITGAQLLTSSSVRVTFSEPPRAVATSAVADVLNALSWALTRLDTGAPLTILVVQQVSPTVFDVLTLEDFGPAEALHEVGSEVALRASDGALIGEPNSALFAGVDVGDAADLRRAGVDLANPQAGGAEHAGGTLRIGDDGDYENDVGLSFLRKLVIRRLSTLAGAFFHLPAYGSGLQLKQFLPISDLVKLREQLELALSREPEFRQVRSRVTLLSDGRLLVEVRVTIDSGGQLQATVEVQNPVVL